MGKMREYYDSGEITMLPNLLVEGFEKAEGSKSMGKMGGNDAEEITVLPNLGKMGGNNSVAKFNS